MLGYPRICCPKCTPPTSLCVLSSAPHPPLSCPPPLPGQGSPCCPLCLSMQQWPWGRSLTLQTANLVSQNVSGGEKNKHNPVSVSMAVTCDSRRHRIPVCSLLGLVPGPTSSPFCPLVLCTHSPSVPKCWALRSPRLQLLWKKLSFSSQALRPPGWPLCPPLFPPYPWPTSGAAHLQSLYLAFLWWVARAWPPPTRRVAHLCARTTGSLNALKSCSVLGTFGPGPPQPGAFGPSLHGDVVSCSRDSRPLHPPTAWDGGAEGAS